MPPSNKVITSFLSTLIGQPHFGAEGPRNASIVTRRTFPYVGGAAGHETTHTRVVPPTSAHAQTIAPFTCGGVSAQVPSDSPRISE